jgi:hypothetical protein
MMHAVSNDREVNLTTYGPADEDDQREYVGTLSPWAAMTLARELEQAAREAATGWRICESCGALMVFARTVNGKAMPLDVGDHPLGNQAASWADGTLRVRGITADNPLTEGEHRVMPHHAVCPGADQWRKARAKPRTGSPAR